MGRSTLKCYMADTGLLISHAFDENGKTPVELYKALLRGSLEVNEGMLMENIVAQMLKARGNKLYFYSKSSREDPSERMEIDFLITKSSITSRHNIIPIEVKSTKNTPSPRLINAWQNLVSISPRLPCFIPPTLK